MEEQQKTVGSGPTQTANRKRPRGKPFEKNDARINTAGRPRKVYSAAASVVDDDPNLPEMLRDMRFVYSNVETEGETPGQKAYRQFLKESPSQFLNQRERLERDYLARIKGEAQTAGTQGVGSAIEELERIDDPVGEALVHEMEAF